MKIKVGLNQKSIKNAINALKTAQRQLKGEMLDEFYWDCYLYFVEHCRQWLDTSTIGEEVKSEINIGWKYKRTKNGAKFINNAEKAVFVEFGVGVVGEDNYHTNANKLGNNYEYNIGTKILSDGSWIFNVTNDSEIDIQQGFILNRTENTVRTKGSPAVMYAFNALEDLRLEYRNIWEKIKIKYWG